MNTDTIKMATNKKYSGFAEDIKDELKSRLAANPEVSNYIKEVESAQAFKNAFANINSGEAL